jgi:hypothetical protein
MNKTTSILIAAAAALALSGSVYAQNNTLATPSVVSPANATSGYSAPAANGTDSGVGTGSSNASQSGNTNADPTSLTNPPGSHNTLATPSVTSPAGQ